MQTLLYSTLTGASPEATSAGDRVYPMLLPQTPTYPAVTYQIIVTEPTSSLDGDSGLDLLRIQVTSWAMTYAAAKALAAEVRTALIAAGMRLVMELDDYEPPEKVFKVITDFSTWYRPQL